VNLSVINESPGAKSFDRGEALTELMKQMALATSIPVILCVVSSSSITLSGQKTNPYNCEVHFLPNGGCMEAMIAKLNKARSAVFVQAYTFTSASIAPATPKVSETIGP